MGAAAGEGDAEIMNRPRNRHAGVPIWLRPRGEPAKLRAKLRAPSPRNHPAVNRSHFGRERGMTIAKLAIGGLLFEVVE